MVDVSDRVRDDPNLGQLGLGDGHRGPVGAERARSLATLVACVKCRRTPIFIIPVFFHTEQQRSRAQDAGAVRGGATLARGYVYPTQTCPLPLSSRSPDPPDFSLFRRLSLLLRQLSLSISRKIITSGRWGEEPADIRTRGGKAMLGLSGGRGAEARGRDDRARLLRQPATQPHRWPSACAFETLLCGVGWTPPRPEGRAGTAHDRPRIRTKTAPTASESMPVTSRQRLGEAGVPTARLCNVGG